METIWKKEKIMRLLGIQENRETTGKKGKIRKLLGKRENKETI